MFYEWIYPLHEQAGLSVLNVFRYITFRSAYAAVTALLDRLLHHAHVLKCGPRSWRTKVQTDLRTEEATK